MGLKNRIYRSLPSKLKPIANVLYQQLVKRKDEGLSVESGDVEFEGVDFIDTFFEGEKEYEKLINKDNTAEIWKTVEEALDRYDELTAEGAFGEAGTELTNACYSLIRKQSPSTVVETGVCNGVSTLFSLKALAENENGCLYSVDYPYRANESLEEFRNETFDQYGGAAIPSDKQPGWIVPNDLRTRWNLKLGKSQLQIPPLLEDLDEVDLFIHDSEHSHPCMMFEYEMAWHYMTSGGVILSDDISWNTAFEVFCRVREPVWGTLSEDVGFMVKR